MTNVASMILYYRFLVIFGLRAMIAITETERGSHYGEQNKKK